MFVIVVLFRCIWAPSCTWLLTSRLCQLTILDLNTNDLTSVSFNIEGLRNLERLILNKNQLETLPAQVPH